MTIFFLCLGGGQHFQQDHNIPSATSLKHLPGHKISDLPGPQAAHSVASTAVTSVASSTASVPSVAASVAASAKLQQQQSNSATGSGPLQTGSEKSGPPEKEADAPVFQGLLDSIGALNKSLSKPTSSSKSDDSQAATGKF